MAITTVTIEGFPKHKLDRARAEVAKAHARLVRSAARQGQTAPDAPVINVLGERVESKCITCHVVEQGYAGGTCMACRKGHLVTRKVVDLEVIAGRPVLAGWEFLAVVEPLEGGNLIRKVPGAEVADGELAPLREARIVCDHCNAFRRRLETFVVRNEAGAYRQVGRNCLAAFLGAKSAAAILGAFTIEKIIRDEGDGDGGGWGGGSDVYDPAEFMAWAAASIRIAGWLSRTAARDTGRQATADHVQFLLTPQTSTEGKARWERAREEFRPTDDDTARGAAALEWAKGLTGASDYEQNLLLVAKQTLVEPSHAGILASAIQAHARVIGEEVARRRRAETPSAHLGTVGEKGATFTATLERVFAIDTAYGPLHIHKFRDDAGNLIVWKTGEARGDVGKTYSLKATIKAHTEYKGEKQTEVTRAKLELVVEAAAA